VRVTEATGDDAHRDRWPGDRLGLPEAGPRSIARFGRRVAAIFIDWAIAYGLSLVLFPVAAWQTDPLITLGIFAALQAILLILFGGSIGHLVLRLRLVPMKGGYLGVWRPIVRTVLLCLVIPAVIWDRDQRGLHDLAAGTMLVRV